MLGRRCETWIPWITVSVATSIFARLCFVTARRLQQYGKIDDALLSNYRPVIITAFFTGVVVLVFIVMSFLLTLGRSKSNYASRSLETFFAMCLFYMFLLTFLCAISMDGFRGYVAFLKNHYEENYTESDYNVFVATFRMGYLCAFSYLWHSLLVAWSAVTFTRRTAGEIPPPPVAAPALVDGLPTAPLLEEAFPTSHASDPSRAVV